MAARWIQHGGSDWLQMGEVVSTIPTIGFNVETVQYNNIKFQVWDLGGQTSIRRLKSDPTFNQSDVCALLRKRLGRNGSTFVIVLTIDELKLSSLTEIYVHPPVAWYNSDLLMQTSGAMVLLMGALGGDCMLSLVISMVSNRRPLYMQKEEMGRNDKLRRAKGTARVAARVLLLVLS
ncbi:hypothetical protein EJB05_17081 [Eragrostis curvula]|uniref:Uncharacterized protein n=1 Tax=Eragrostis curvula TaxID=38414 RepID=A0A5J9VGJ3_9POAL|nr:hypothetical protein EJB05_17081 [Eragrostis curvula]